MFKIEPGVSDIEDLRKARSGDRESILAVLRVHGVDPIIIGYIDGAWHRGRERDHASFLNLVAARKHYVRRGWVNIAKAERIAEITTQFSISPNVAKHLANGQGYEAVRAEAQKQLKAEAEESNFSKVGFPTA
jgi:hypothetical protein